MPESAPLPTVAFATLATHRYRRFVAPLLVSCREYFLTDCAVTPIVFTDDPTGIEAECHRIAHEAWPGVALNKFGILARHRERLAAFDYVFLSDVDMRFVAPVGREVLGGLVAVRHPGFHDRSEAELTYERRPDSRAYIAPGTGRAYYAGGFTGGRSTVFLPACEEIQAGVEADLARGIVAVWHDESHWNRHLVDHPPAVELSPSYCYPESWSLPFVPRLLALDKDHAALRHGWFASLAARASDGLRAWARAVRRLAGPR